MSLQSKIYQFYESDIYKSRIKTDKNNLGAELSEYHGQMLEDSELLHELGEILEGIKMKKIDIETWKRKSTYNNFIKYSNPVFSISTKVDVTELVDFCKKNGKSFFITFLYIVTICANDVEEMRSRIVDGEVISYDSVRPSYIVALENEEIATCISDFDRDYNVFYLKVHECIERAKRDNVARFNDVFVSDCFYISCLPWLDFVSVSNPYNYSDVTSTSIPRITWGKYVKDSEGRYKMSIDIAAHHALIDGRQVAKVYEYINNALSSVKKYLGVGGYEG